MTRDDARALLSTLAMASTAPTLTNDELDAALTSARLKDDAGRGPADPDFVEENWDLYYAAAECYELKAAKVLATGQLTEFTSEGANFKKTPPNYQAVADWYRDRSTVGDSSSPSMITIDSRPPWWMRPRSTLEEC